MALCPRCGALVPLTEPHVCGGRDRGKRRWLALVVAAALAGALLGGWLGDLYGRWMVAQACAAPHAGNLCGVMVLPEMPATMAAGAVLGMVVLVPLAIFLLGRRPSGH